MNTHARPALAPGIRPARARRRTSSGCMRRNPAASLSPKVRIALPESDLVRVTETASDRSALWRIRHLADAFVKVPESTSLADPCCSSIESRTDPPPFPSDAPLRAFAVRGWAKRAMLRANVYVVAMSGVRCGHRRTRSAPAARSDGHRGVLRARRTSRARAPSSRVLPAAVRIARAG